MYKKIYQQQKAGSFSNVATIRINDDEVIWVEENVNDILVRQENQYKDWLCWAGIASLMIDSIGDVTIYKKLNVNGAIIALPWNFLSN